MMRAAIEALFLAVLLGSAGCRAEDPPGTPEATCVKACGTRASAKCTDVECRRGCRISLDRMIEREGSRVLSCVASAKNRKCDELTWADCTASIGVHADGGPPAPPPGKEDFDEDD